MGFSGLVKAVRPGALFRLLAAKPPPHPGDSRLSGGTAVSVSPGSQALLHQGLYVLNSKTTMPTGCAEGSYLAGIRPVTQRRLIDPKDLTGPPQGQPLDRLARDVTPNHKLRILLKSM